MNKAVQSGLVNTSGFALEKDHKKVIEKLIGERPAAGIAIRDKIQYMQGRVVYFVNQHREENV